MGGPFRREKRAVEPRATASARETAAVSTIVTRVARRQGLRGSGSASSSGSVGFTRAGVSAMAASTIGSAGCSGKKPALCGLYLMYWASAGGWVCCAAHGPAEARRLSILRVQEQPSLTEQSLRFVRRQNRGSQEG